MSITTSAPYGLELEAMPLEAFGGVGGFRMKPIPGSLQLHGGGFKKAIVPVIAITAAVVAPVAIPAMAGAIASSAAISVTASYVAAGAVYGAASGALTAAIGGGNVGRSALIGGAIGGAGGYIAAPSASAAPGVAGAGGGLGPTTDAAAAGQMVGGAPSLTPPAAPTVAAGGGIGGSNIASTSQLANQVATGAPTVGLSTTGAPASLGAQLSGASGTIGGTGIQSVSIPPPTAATFGGTAPTGLGPTTTAAAPGGQLATAPIAGTQAAAQDPSFLSRLGTGVSEVGSKIADRFTDPERLADMTLRAAGQLAGSAVAGDGLSEQQQQLVDMEMEQLQELQQTNQAAFNQRLEAATALLGESRYFDPEYFGLQRARQQQIAGGQAKRKGTRGLTGEQRRAESRRFDLETGRNVGTAFDQGYLTGVEGRLQTQQAGLNAMPLPNQYATDYGATSARLRANEEQRLAAAQGVGNLFGGLTGMSQSRSQG